MYKAIILVAFVAVSGVASAPSWMQKGGLSQEAIPFQQERYLPQVSQQVESIKGASYQAPALPLVQSAEPIHFQRQQVAQTLEVPVKGHYQAPLRQQSYESFKGGYQSAELPLTQVESKPVYQQIQQVSHPIAQVSSSIKGGDFQDIPMRQQSFESVKGGYHAAPLQQLESRVETVQAPMKLAPQTVQYAAPTSIKGGEFLQQSAPLRQESFSTKGYSAPLEQYEAPRQIQTIEQPMKLSAPIKGSYYQAQAPLRQQSFESTKY